MLWGLASTLLLTSLALLTLSLRGRRIGSSPHCRKCRFDLSGLDPTCCPECGRDLLHAGAVIYGRRARRPLFLAIGAASLLLGLATAGLAISATSGDLNPYKPAWLLEIEAARLKGNARDAAAAELLARHQNSPLRAEQLAALVEPALDAQVDPTTNWDHAPWWQLLDAAFATGAASDALRRRYVEQALAGLDVRTPTHMLASEPWPQHVADFRPSLRESPRIAPAQPVGFIATIDAATIDGEPLPLARLGHDSPGGWSWMAYLHGIGARPTMFGLSGHTSFSSIIVPFESHRLELPPVEPGEHTLRLRYSVRAFATPGLTFGGPGASSVDPAKPTSHWTLDIERGFTAMATPKEIAHFATADEARGFDPSMESNPKSTIDAIALLPSDPPRTRFMYSLSRADIRPGTPWIVGRVELRSGERAWPALAIWPLQGRAEPITVNLAPRPHVTQGQGLDFSVPDFPRLDEVDVVIVPDLHAAAMAGINAPVWGEEIVLKDVPINWFQLPAPDDPRADDDTPDE